MNRRLAGATVRHRGGRIAYAGGQGPFGFEPEDVAKWLGKTLGPAE